MEVFRSILLLQLLYLCAATIPSESEIQNYMDTKLSEFQLELQNDFHKKRIDRSADNSGGVPYRSEILSKDGPIDLGFPQPSTVIKGFEVVHNDLYSFVIAYTSTGNVYVNRADKNDMSNFQPHFTVNSLGGAVISATAVHVDGSFFLVFAVDLDGGKYRFHVYEFTYNTHTFHHTIDCGGIMLSSIKLGYSSGHLFLISSSYGNYFTNSFESFLDVYHWRSQHFDPVSSKHRNPIRTKGVYDLVAWEYYGEVRFALLQFHLSKFGQVLQSSEIVVYSITSDEHRAFHGSHFEVVLDQKIALSFRGYSLAYYFNGVQNLAVTSLSSSTRVFYVYSTLTKSIHFVYNNLQTPFVDGSSSIIASIPHPYPDDIICYFDNTTNTMNFFNQDIRLRYHHNFDYTKSSSIIDLKALVLSHESNYAKILILSIGHPPISSYAHVIQIDIRPLNKTTDVLIECLKDLEELIEERRSNITYLNEATDYIFVKDKYQNVTTSIIVQGKTVTNRIHTRNLKIETPEVDVPNITHSKLLEHVIETREQVDEVEEESTHVVYKTLQQTINGTLEFNKSISVTNLTVDIIKNNVLINNVQVSRLISNTLKSVGNQTITYPFVLTTLAVENNLRVTGHINGKNVQDLVHTNRTQILVGTYTFTVDVTFARLVVHEINGVKPEYLVLTNRDQFISGKKTFHVIRTTNIKVQTTTNGRDLSEFASRVVTLTNNHTITGHWLIHQLTIDGDIHLVGLISNVINITDLAINVVTIHTQQTIYGHITFVTNIIIKGSLITIHINGVDTTTLVTLNTVQNITGEFTFKEYTSVTKSITVDFINQISVSNYVLRKASCNITAHKIFEGSIHINGNIIMDEGVLIDTVDPSELEKEIAPSESTVDIHGSIDLEHLVIYKDTTFGNTVNGYNISEITEIFWRKTVYQEINVAVLTSPHVHFKKDISSDNGVNGKDLDQDYVHVFGNETVTGHVQFKDKIHVKGNIELDTNVTVNGYDISVVTSKAVMKYGPDQEIKGTVYFENDVTVTSGDVFVTGTVNGYDISEDFLDKDSEQTIYTRIHYESRVTIRQDLIATIIILPPEGRVNEIKISKLVNDLVLLNTTTNRVIRNKTFKHLRVHNLTIDGEFNGINFKNFTDTVVTLSTNQIVGGSKTFEDHVRFEANVYVEFLNDIQFTPYAESVINRTEDTVVTGNKTVEGSIFINGEILISEGKTINGIDVSLFKQRAMVNNKLQNVTGYITFITAIVHIDNLEIKYGTLDGVDLDKVALITRDTTLTGHISFATDVFINDELTVKGLVYGCDLYFLYLNAIRLSGVPSQTITGVKTINEVVTVDPGNVIIAETKTVNNVDLSVVGSTILQRNGSLNATGNYEFNTLIVTDLTITNLINGKNLSFIFEDAVLVDKNQTIVGNKVFNRSVKFIDLKVLEEALVNSTINGVTLKDLKNESITRTENVTIFGAKTFLSNITINTLNISKTINGIEIKEDLWLINSSDSLVGVTTFESETIIEGNLKVEGLIDGKNLSELVRDRVTLSSNQTINRHLVFEDDVIVKGNCHVDGNINDVDPDDVVTTSGDFTIDGFKKFNETVHVKGNVNVDLINEVNIKELSETVVRKNVETVITSKTAFTNEVSFEHNINVTGTVDGIDISVEVEQFRTLQQNIYSKIDELFETQQNQSYDNQYIHNGINGQTVVPSHFHKVEWNSSTVIEFYRKDCNGYDGNVPNPVELYGLIPGPNCLSGCTCTVSCNFKLNGQDLIKENCGDFRALRACANSYCYEVRTPQNVASETCLSSIEAGISLFGGKNPMTIRSLMLPLVTGITIITINSVQCVVLASPTNGHKFFPASVYCDLQFGLENKGKLAGSEGAEFVETVYTTVNGVTESVIVAAGGHNVTLHVINSNDDLQLNSTYCTHLMKSDATGLVKVKGRNNESFVIVSTAIINPGFLMQEEAPTLLLFDTFGGNLVLKHQVFTGSIYHISVLNYAGDTYIVTSQTDDDRVVLFRLEGVHLVKVDLKIPIINPTATLPTYHYKEKPFTITNTTLVNNYEINDMLLFLLSPERVSTLRTVQFGNGINLETAKP